MVMSKEEFEKMDLEQANHTLGVVIILVDQVEFDLQAALQDCCMTDEIENSSIDKIAELNRKLAVIKEAGNNMFQRKQRLERKQGMCNCGCEDFEDHEEEGDYYEKGDLPEDYEIVGFTKKEYEELNDIRNY